MDLERTALLLFSYIAGAIPFGLIFARLFSGKDIRKAGSGNIGTANVIRNVGLVAGSLTFLFDVLKGLFPVLIALKFFDIKTASMVGLLAVIGHIFPIFLKFRGGKGVATAFGVMLGMNYTTAFLSFVIFLIVMLLFRISSLSSLIATISNLISNLFISYERHIVILNILFLLLIVYRHRENIYRLLRGEERKMWGERKI